MGLTELANFLQNTTVESCANSGGWMGAEARMIGGLRENFF